MNRILLSTGILALSLFSCNVKTEVNPDHATAIAGTYAIKTYQTNSSTNNNVAAGNNLVITKVDNNTVKVVIDYATGTDVTSDKVAITKSDNMYKLSQSFSNASAAGAVSGSTASWSIAYNDGSYANVTATK